MGHRLKSPPSNKSYQLKKVVPASPVSLPPALAPRDLHIVTSSGHRDVIASTLLTGPQATDREARETSGYDVITSVDNGQDVDQLTRCDVIRCGASGTWVWVVSGTPDTPDTGQLASVWTWVDTRAAVTSDQSLMWCGLTDRKHKWQDSGTSRGVRQWCGEAGGKTGDWGSFWSNLLIGQIGCQNGHM